MNERFGFSDQKAEEQHRFEMEMLGREEYREGSIPLEFRHVFSGGAELSATQNKDGTARIVLGRGTQPLLDFQELLPEGYLYTTPRYVLDHQEELETPVFLGTWGAYQKLKMVHVGDWTKPEHLFNLFHEVGHTRQDTNRLEVLEAEVERRKKRNKNFRTTVNGIELLKEFSEELSKSERDAWARAIHLAKQIRDRFDVDLIGDIFSSPEKIEVYIHNILRIYRKTREEMDWEDGGIFLKNLFDKER